MNTSSQTKWSKLQAGMLLMLAGAVSQAQAAVCAVDSVSTSNGTVCMDGTNATDILNIGIDPDGAGGAGTTFYDVLFEFMAVGPLPADGDAFANDVDGAEAAAIAVGTALDEALAATVGTGFGGGSLTFSVPWKFNDNACGDGTEGTCSWDGTSPIFSQTPWASVGGGEHDNSTSSLEYARFTPAPVPLPPAAFLFASGLSVLLGLRGRRRRISIG